MKRRLPSRPFCFGARILGPFPACLPITYRTRKKRPHAIEIDGLPVFEDVPDVRVRRVRQSCFNLLISVSLRRCNEVGNVEIDSKIG